MWFLALIRRYRDTIVEILQVAGVGLDQILAMGVMREDAGGFVIDAQGNRLFPSRTSVATYAELIALDPVEYDGYRMICREYNYSDWICNGVSWLPVNGHYRSKQQNALDLKVVVANAVTWVASNNSGKIRLTTTANAAHGLTALSVGYSLVLKTAPNLWPAANTRHAITAVNDTSGVRTVDLATDWVSSMGTDPVFFTVNPTNLTTMYVPVTAFTLDKLRKNSRVEIGHNWEFVVDAGATNRRVIFKVGTKFMSNWVANVSATNTATVGRFGFKNLGATNLNRGLYGESSSGFAGASDPITLDEETNAGIEVKVYVSFPSAVDKGMSLASYAVDVWDLNEEDADVTPPAALRNWNPGHYMEASDPANWDNTSLTNPGVLQRLSADTGGRWKGASIRVSWVDLEGATLGDYSPMYALLDNYLQQISGFTGKHLIVFLQLKTFNSGGNAPAVPLYMRDSATYADPDGFGNGHYAYGVTFSGTGGYVPNMHVDAVQARFDALMAAFAARYNDNPLLEMLMFSEPNIQYPTGATLPWSRKATWYANMTESFQTLRNALTNIQINQWTSAARADMSTYDTVGPTWTGFVPDLIDMGVGIGLTDVCYNDEGLTGFMPPDDHPSNLYFVQQCAGLTAVVAHMSRPSYDGTVVNQNQGCNCPTGTGRDQCNPQVTTSPYWPGPAVSRQAQVDWAVDTAGATHIIWVHNTGNQTTVPLPVYAADQPCKQATMPPIYSPSSDAYSGSYSGKKYNLVTDQFIQGASALDIATVETRPTGW